ncbi:MAG: flagellar hook-basal body complex protein FliE [Myxococcota bacterium]
MAIDPIGSGARPSLGANEAHGGAKFAEAMTELLRDVNADQIDAARQIKSLLVDGNGSIHEAMIAMGKAEGSLRLLMEMRNRLVDGINRLLQTQV